MKQRIPRFKRQEIMGSLEIKADSQEVKSSILNEEAQDSSGGIANRSSVEQSPDTYIYEIPDNSLIAELFRRNHPRLYAWLNTAQGQTYVAQQVRGEA